MNFSLSMPLQILRTSYDLALRRLFSSDYYVDTAKNIPSIEDFKSVNPRDNQAFFSKPYLKETLGLVFYLIMSMAHNWGWFGPHGGSLWLLWFLACSAMTAWIGSTIFRSYALDLLRIGSLMTLIFLGVILSFSGLSLGLGSIIVATALLGLLRSLLGHIGEDNYSWYRAMVKITMSQIALFSCLWMVSATLPVQIIAWMLLSSIMIYTDRPQLYSGAGMVITSFVSTYLSWLALLY